MKKFLISIAVLYFAVPVSLLAQDLSKYGPNAAECLQYLSFYEEDYKLKQKEHAIPSWRKAYQLCPPQSRKTMIVYGADLIRILIQKNAKDPVYKAALVDTLMTLYDTRVKYWPNDKVTALNNKGVDLNNYVKDNDVLYKNYEEIIGELKGETKASILLFDFKVATELYKKGDIDAEKVIDIYQRNSSYLDKADNGPAKDKVKSDMGSLFAASKVADCESLLALYGPRLKAEPDNLSLVNSIVKTMGMTDDCIDNDLFLEAVTTLNRLDPSVNSAYSLFKLNAAKGNVDDAIKNLEQAIASDETDAAKDAEYSYQLAAFCYKNGRNARAVEFANNAMNLDLSYTGKSYLFIGTVWANTSCGTHEIYRFAPYWVACDYFQRAKNADESLTEEANRLIGIYSSRYPKKAEAFMYDIKAGEPYTAVCGGMRAATTVKLSND